MRRGCGGETRGGRGGRRLGGGRVAGRGTARSVRHRYGNQLQRHPFIRHRVALQWPTPLQSTHRRATAHRALLAGWLAGVPAGLLSRPSLDTAATETVPALLHAMVAHLRPVSLQIMTPEERGELDRLVGLCLGYGVSYSLAQGGEGEPVPPVPLTPALDGLCSYEGVGGRSAVPLAVRQTVAHEAAMKRIQLRDAVCRMSDAV